MKNSSPIGFVYFQVAADVAIDTHVTTAPIVKVHKVIS